MSARPEWVPLAEACLHVGLNRERLIRRVQAGRIRGRQNVTGGWEIELGSLDEYAEQYPDLQRSPRGRRPL